MKVAIFYRVIQDWRAPVFERLAKLPDWDVTVFHGCDFPGTKVTNTKRDYSFKRIAMRSVPIRLRKNNASGVMLVPFSPGIIGHLIHLRPDVVVCEGASNFINNLFVFIYCKVMHVPIIHWGLGEIRGAKRSWFRKVVDIFHRPIERRSDAIISYSSYGASYYRRIGVPDDRIVVAVNVVDTDERQSEIQSVQTDAIERKDGFHVLYVGALEPQKRVDRLLRAFAELQKIRPRTHLTIVGDGVQMPTLKKQASDLSLRNTSFEGKVVDGVSKYFLSADVFVLPGLGGLAVSDALVHGVPVICTIGDGCEADLICTGYNGIWDEHLDDHSLCAHLLKLHDSPELLNEMKCNASTVISKFNIDNYIDKIRMAVHIATKKNDFHNY